MLLASDIKNLHANIIIQQFSNTRNCGDDIITFVRVLSSPFCYQALRPIRIESQRKLLVWLKPANKETRYLSNMMSQILRKKKQQHE